MTDLSAVRWRKSSRSTGGGMCVEMAPLPDGRIAVRNSNHPELGVLFFTRDEIAAWLGGVKLNEFDYLV